MKKYMIKWMLPVGLFFCGTVVQAQAIKRDVAREERISALLARMTIEEKIGQMTQLTIDEVLKVDGQQHTLPGIELDAQRLKEAVETYHVGSILNTSGHVLPRDKWKELVSGIQDEAARTRLKIPVVYGIDAIHGVNYTQDATLFPQEIALAATFNPKLAFQVGEITAYETRASYIPWNFSPVLDLGKSPLWPRMYETFGEDPYLVKTMGVAMIRGYQGTGDSYDQYHVAACMKHYLGYSYPLSGKDRTPAWIPDRYMREYFLPSFREAVKAGAATVMVNSAEINGVPVHASHYLLTDVLRGELGFEGVIVTDWQDIKYLHDRHHVAATQKEAVLLAIHAGIDMSMVPYDYSFYDYLLALVREGKVTVSRIDASVRRILRMKDQMGLFRTPVMKTDAYPKFGSEEFRQVSVQAAREAITLLKNNNHTLPLAKGQKILVTGPTANTMRSVDGGWSYNWQGDVNDEFGSAKHTFLEGLQQKLGVSNVTYVPGTTYDSVLNIGEAVQAAQGVDAIVLFLGELSYAENPGNINDLTLPAAQLTLARELAKTGKPVVLVLAEGRPRIVTAADAVSAATITTYFIGNEGADVLADVLMGDVNPSGKLSFTYPRFVHALNNYYRKNLENGNSDDKESYNPLYEFGTGLSYTTFAYSNLKVDKAELKEGEKLTVTVDVKNTGSRSGLESVLLYTSDVYASVTPDTKRLRAFDKISLLAGETKTVSFTLTAADLAFIGDDNKPVTEPGEFVVRVGDQEVSFQFVTGKAVNVSEGKL